MSTTTKHYTRTLFLNSDPNTGAYNINAGKNQFSITLQPSLKIPQTAYNIQAYLRSASIWYTFLNVSSANNKIYFTDDVVDPQKYTITLLNGLYSLSDLNNAVQVALQNMITTSGYTFPNDVIQLGGDSASGRSITNITASGYQVNWLAGTPYFLLGVDLNTRYPSAGALSQGNEYYYSQSQANFGQTTNLVITTNLTNSYNYNGNPSNIIGNIPINVAPGSLISYSPYQYMKLDASNLQGMSISQIDSTLLTEDLAPIDTNGEAYSYELIFEYDVDQIV